jgi:exodeoxyribonuclease VII small subunit
MKRKDSGASQPEGASQSFEEMMQRLEALVTELEKGQLSLEDSIRTFEEGIGLVKKCSAVLGEAQKRVQKLTKEGAESAETEPLDDEKESGDDAGEELPF